MIDYRHIINRKIEKEEIIEVVSSQRETVKQKGYAYKDFEALHFFIDIILLTVITALFYYTLRSRVTGAAMIASHNVWYKSLPVFIFSLLLALPLMGVTLGTITSRQFLNRNITVDWYSVIGGTLLLGVIYYIPYINVIVLTLLYILTFVALIQSYIVKE